MAKRVQWIVVTDLDASLLDESYSYEAAFEALDLVEAQQIPLVLNSSKTLDEMIVMAKDWQWKPKPILVGENGATLAFPCEGENAHQGIAAESDWSDYLRADSVQGGYLSLYEPEERAEILRTLQWVKKQNHFAFKGFSDFTDEELSGLTGLSDTAVQAAKNRQATEPILWESSDEDYAAFIQIIKGYGFKALRGGQFTHIMHAKYDKAIGMASVVSLFAKRYPDSIWKTLALGDSPNDAVMLEQADFAIVIPNKAKGTMTLKRKDYLLASDYASEGWNTSVLQFLKSTQQFI
jgi:mannosyl-3-phosphoglycerate phosphatase